MGVLGLKKPGFSCNRYDLSARIRSFLELCKAAIGYLAANGAAAAVSGAGVFAGGVSGVASVGSTLVAASGAAGGSPASITGSSVTTGCVLWLCPAAGPAAPFVAGAKASVYCSPPVLKKRPAGGLLATAGIMSVMGIYSGSAKLADTCCTGNWAEDKLMVILRKFYCNQWSPRNLPWNLSPGFVQRWGITLRSKTLEAINDVYEPIPSGFCAHIHTKIINMKHKTAFSRAANSTDMPERRTYTNLFWGRTHPYTWPFFEVQC